MSYAVRPELAPGRRGEEFGEWAWKSENSGALDRRSQEPVATYASRKILLDKPIGSVYHLNSRICVSGRMFLDYCHEVRSRAKRNSVLVVQEVSRMKDRRITAFVVLLALAVACFISASVFPGEHPWDSEGSKGGSGSTGGGIIGGGDLPPIDPRDSMASSTMSVGAQPPMNAWTRLVFEVSYRTVRFLFGFEGLISQVRLGDRTHPGSR